VTAPGSSLARHFARVDCRTRRDAVRAWLWLLRYRKVFKIANQDKVKGLGGKKAKMKCRPVKDATDTMYIDNLYLGG
jgi:hypothetical protein